MGVHGCVQWGRYGGIGDLGAGGAAKGDCGDALLDGLGGGAHGAGDEGRGAEICWVEWSAGGGEKMIGGGRLGERGCMHPQR